MKITLWIVTVIRSLAAEISSRLFSG